MSSISRFLHPIRALKYPSSRLAYPETPKLINLNSWIKGLVPAARGHSNGISFDFKFRIRDFLGSMNFGRLGGKLGSVAGVSFLLALGNTFSRPKIALCSNGLETSIDNDDRGDMLDDPDEMINQTITRMYFSRFWLLVLFAATVFGNLNQPVELLIRVVLFLLSTRPSPLSVYLFIEQMRRLSVHQSPLVTRSKSLYAHKVEVQDYKLLCLARVELRNQKLNLIGILGGWVSRAICILLSSLGDDSIIENGIIKDGEERHALEQVRTT